MGPEMDAFTTFEAAALPIDIPNCDTDRIIPARFLRLEPETPDYDRLLTIEQILKSFH